MELHCEEAAGTGYAGLVLLAALIAIEIARNLTTSQITLLSNFFEVLGDNLAVLAIQPPPCQCSSTQNTVEE